MTSKAVRKRIRLTKRGKLIRRVAGADHFRTSKSKKVLRQKKKTRTTHRRILSF